jgi:hypothetical protein
VFESGGSFKLWTSTGEQTGDRRLHPSTRGISAAVMVTSDEATESAVVQFMVRRAVWRRLIPAFFAALLGIYFLFMILVAPVGAISGFVRGHIAEGLYFLFTTIVLGFALIIPIMMCWARFKRAISRMELRLDDDGIAKIFAGASSHPIRWEVFSEVTLDDRFFTVRVPHHPVSKMLLGGFLSPAGDVWIHSRVSRLMIEDAKLRQVLSRYYPGS